MLSHDEQVAILEKRKSALLARQFMALWVEEDGTVKANYVGEGGRLEVVPVVFVDGD